MLLAIAALAAFAMPIYVGCSKQAPSPAPTATAHEEHEGHSADEHAAAGHIDADHEHEHGGHALTEESAKTPESFAAGVARLKELHQEINHLIENNELADVHPVAEEMAIVARKMKGLASRDIAENNRLEAGQLCNDIAGYFTPIDEAADSGNKAETSAIHKQMAATISKLKAFHIVELSFGLPEYFPYCRREKMSLQQHYNPAGRHYLLQGVH